MTDFDTIQCKHCGESFRIHPGARAAETGYCSPACHSAGAGLN